MHFKPHNWDESAHPWEWLPALAHAIFAPFGKVEILLRAPLNLKALQRWSISNLRYKLQPIILLRLNE